MKTTQKITALTLALLLLVSLLVGCGKKVDTGIWENATYQKDTTVGKGNTVFTLTVEAEGQSVVLTVKTDETTLGNALLALNLIAGDAGAYGLYVKTVNGMTADYDTDGSYWAFYIGDEMAMTGVDGCTLTDGGAYRLSRETMSW